MSKNNLMKVSIEQLMYKNFIKYDKLVEMVNTVFVGSNATSINIFIDVYSMVKILYKSKNILIEDYSSLTASIINLCAHLRDFFRTRYNTTSKIYIVASKNSPTMNILSYPSYNSDIIGSMNSMTSIDEMVVNNMELLETLCPYLPDIFFIKGEYETGVYMYDIMCKNEILGNIDPNIIITRDPYNFQLIPMRENTVVFRPKKQSGADLSYYLDKNNLFERFLITDRLVVAKNKITINPGLFTVFLALSKLPERRIKSLFNTTKAINILDEAVATLRLHNGYNSDMERVWNSIYKDSFGSIGYSTFKSRFDVIDIQSQHYGFANSPYSKGVVFPNLHDPETIKLINNKYFKKTPLDLNRL